MPADVDDRIQRQTRLMESYGLQLLRVEHDKKQVLADVARAPERILAAGDVFLFSGLAVTVCFALRIFAGGGSPWTGTVALLAGIFAIYRILYLIDVSLERKRAPALLAEMAERIAELVEQIDVERNRLATLNREKETIADDKRWAAGKLAELTNATGAWPEDDAARLARVLDRMMVNS